MIHELGYNSAIRVASMLAEALQARLKVLEDEILRLTQQASQAPDQIHQDNDLRLAQDLQREARALRFEIRRLSESSPAAHSPAC
jgi:hypothetical protein